MDENLNGAAMEGTAAVAARATMASSAVMMVFTLIYSSIVVAHSGISSVYCLNNWPSVILALQ